ncbi:hypothetical protein FOMPIDRAFT_1020464 [Fomitopsis schrenkii]|uniref:DUF6533 domain-containing protein n=1 Tax=Fomitopsis schrenkii TaxID=2126942 RepID=S8DLS3_FOMSC|nr:hypothetical protein FOMPIDRAFT_1020464 [Fomitopsis schrenkii]
MRVTGVQDLQSALQQAPFKGTEIACRVSNNYVLVASFAVYLFDRSLLFGQEANYIWRYRLSIVPALTILLHGATVLNFALLCYEQMVNLDCKRYNVPIRCTLHISWIFDAFYRALPGNIASEVALAVFDSVIALITALRVYAVNNREWRMSCIVFLLSLIRTAYDLLRGALVWHWDEDGDDITTSPRLRRRKHVLNKWLEDAGLTMSFLVLRDDANIIVTGTIYFGLLLIISILDVVIYTADSFQGFQYLRLAFVYASSIAV